MTNKTKPLFAASLVGLFASTAFDGSAAVAPRPPEEMMEEATHVVRGKVVALSSKTLKSKIERGPLIARDRIFKITLKLTAVEKGKDVKEGDELTLEAWQPSTRIPPMPGPQGHQPVPGKGDLVKTYLLYNKKTKTYHPFMPNGIAILEQGK
tara:strand:+ start:344 stop:799 length:456 start_codon:yes stop_codon:yes gene_type:complete